MFQQQMAPTLQALQLVMMFHKAVLTILLLLFMALMQQLLVLSEWMGSPTTAAMYPLHPPSILAIQPLENLPVPSRPQPVQTLMFTAVA
jgi:hypothetical protein